MYKRLLICLLICLAHVSVFAVQLYVSTTGDDANQGTKEKPFATLQMALRAAREIRRLNQLPKGEFILITMSGGVYQLNEPVVIRPEDAGGPVPTMIKAAEGEYPILSGGINIAGWSKAKNNIAGLPKEARGKVWVSDAPEVGDQLIDFRQMWVNNHKATRANTMRGDSMMRILSWNHKDQSCWIPKPKTADLTRVKGMEMLIHQMWAIAILRVKTYEPSGDSVKLTFQQPESRIQSEHPWPAPFISRKTGNSAFYLTNAIQFLDQPGEWYLDKKARKLYYWPRGGEDLTTANVVVPVLENLVKIEGNAENPVSGICFNGISFMYAGWLRPSQQGIVPHQAGMYMLDAYKLKIPGTPDKKGLENQAWVGRPEAAVKLSYTKQVEFEKCRFLYLASTGLDLVKGTYQSHVMGCLFKDIGGSGILDGTFSDESTEVHLPYNPTNPGDVCTYDRFDYNLITDVANEDWGCVGIGAGYVKGIAIRHNEICDVSYTGISVGWGWTRTANAMSDNKVTGNKITRYAKHMYDVAGIYTLSNQPGTVIAENYVDSIYKAPYAHDPHHWFYLYLDEGSSNITVRDNWTPTEKYLKNANGPGNVWENNGPVVSDGIKNAAGIIPTYQYLLIDKTPNLTNQAINH
ncbi:right-handed parallel beta-helix repeat-containing protein [Mucilaginibacter sp. PPCGB 2223]|uniref:right-handed parallel beta-helix repeat-containing protein n=1 Tax=Mucilaginibacter sp. PPCGB 2223 TaxID=1886027 RepID=UPI0009F4E4BF|nr:right-handed parallel beta-helix repeat-containing protein [Mucilaginibacter sp. PPCGB 2223]